METQKRNQRSDAFADRNRKIVALINSGVKQIEVARQFQMTRARVSEIYHNPRWNPPPSVS